MPFFSYVSVMTNQSFASKIYDNRLAEFSTKKIESEELVVFAKKLRSEESEKCSLFEEKEEDMEKPSDHQNQTQIETITSIWNQKLGRLKCFPLVLDLN